MIPATPDNTTAVILAGGLGTRLRSVVVDRPKVLAPVSGKPFLYYLLRQLEAAGFSQIVICTGYRAEMVQEELSEFKFSLSLAYSREDSPLGTGGALRLALSQVADPWLCVLNGDSYCSLDFADFFQFYNRTQAVATIALREIADAGRFGRVTLNSNGKIVAFEEKGSAGAGLINTGIYLIHRELVASIPEGRAVSLERESFLFWVRDGQLNGYLAPDAKFIDIGTPESFAQAEEFFKY